MKFNKGKCLFYFVQGTYHLQIHYLNNKLIKKDHLISKKEKLIRYFIILNVRELRNGINIRRNNENVL